MIKKYNRLSLLFGIPGFLMQGFLFIWGQEVWGLAGLLLFAVGIAFHAKSLGRSLFWGLTGLLGWFSMLVLLFLKDRSNQSALAGKENV